MSSIIPTGAYSARGAYAAETAGRATESQRVRESTAKANSSVSDGRRGEDRVEVSVVATYMNILKQLPDIREDLVDRVKGEIERGTYETPERIEGAIDGFFAEAAD